MYTMRGNPRLAAIFPRVLLTSWASQYSGNEGSYRKILACTWVINSSFCWGLRRILKMFWQKAALKFAGSKGIKQSQELVQGHISVPVSISEVLWHATVRRWDLNRTLFENQNRIACYRIVSHEWKGEHTIYNVRFLRYVVVRRKSLYGSLH